MSDLGNLYFGVSLRDMTDQDIEKIKKKLQSLDTKLDFGVNAEHLRKSVADALEKEMFNIDVSVKVKEQVKEQIRQTTGATPSDVRSNLIDTRNLRTEAYVNATNALAELRRAKTENINASKKHNAALQNENLSFKFQNSIVGQLADRIAGLYSLGTIEQFITSVARIGGEFQQQHVALQTILGDAQKVDVIFERLKGLAVESSFKFKDLSSYTKQLAAYGVEYEELYETTKRLGDISAGVGVDMNRLILAFGQVRSAEFLKGTELRQFTEAGIPLVSELAKRYTELEGKLVSVGDVFDRISKKQVSFADVRSVLWDLTNEGGRFFDMQSKLTDTLKGKLDKLADTYEIMLSEIANANNDVLGGSLDMLAGILSHWEEILKIIGPVISAYGSYRAAILAVAAAQKVAMAVEPIWKAIKSIQFLRNTTLAAASAQYALNAASKANPWVLGITAIGTIIGTIVSFSMETENAASKLAEFNAKAQEQSEELKNIENSAKSYANVLSNSNNSLDKRKEAFDELNRIYPEMFRGMKLEQALLLKDVELYKMVGDAAREAAIEKAKANVIEAENKVSDAETEINRLKLRGAGEKSITLRRARENHQAALAMLDSANATLENLQSTEEKILEIRTERWYNEAKSIAESAGEIFKEFLPKDGEEREEYFERIGNAVDNVDAKIKKLNKDSNAAKEVLPDLETEQKVVQRIYTEALGGKLDGDTTDKDAELERQKKEAAKQAKEIAKSYAKAVQDEISKIASQWDLYKQLFEATGNKEFAMSAFTVTPVWDEAATQMRDQLESRMKEIGLDIELEFDIDDNVAKSFYGEFYDSWKQIKDRIEKNGIDLKINAADAISESKDFAQQIEDIERNLQEKLQALRIAYANDPEKLKRAEQEAISKVEEEKTKLNFEEFKKSSDWVKVFDDLDRVSDATLDNMISKVEEFAKQAHLSEEVTKQLVEAMGKLRDESIERNPLEGFKDAWNRASYWRNYDVNAAYNKQYNDKTGKFEQKLSQEQVDNNLAEANDDLKESALAVADKFQAVANAADLLSGLFEGLGIDLGGLSDVLGGAASGAQAGAGIASALGMAGPWGAIAGAAVGMLSSVFAMHDKALQKEIEASEEREKLIKNIADNLEAAFERNLGGVYTMGVDEETKTLLKDYIKRYELYASNPYLSDRAIASKDSYEKAHEALRENSYYDAQKALLQLQRDELEHQMQLEDEKKKTDKSKIADYEQQIKEIEAEIKNLAVETAEALYGIDFIGWANQLAESLVDAWAKGEDAVEAYKNTVNDILREVGLSVISQKIIEPLLKSTMEEFLVQFDKDNGKLTDKSMEILAGMADGAEYAASATEAYLEGLKKLGIDLSETSDESKGGLSKDIKGVTEDTASLLASYINAVRGDVAAKRILIEKLISEDVPKMNYLAEAQLQQLQMIVTNTKRNADVATEIRDLFNRVVDKSSNKIKI